MVKITYNLLMRICGHNYVMATKAECPPQFTTPEFEEWADAALDDTGSLENRSLLRIEEMSIYACCSTSIVVCSVA